MLASMLNAADAQPLSPALHELYAEAEAAQSTDHAAKPVIGLVAHATEAGNSVADAYVKAVSDAGGVPVILPIVDNLSLLDSLLDTIDALLLTGGCDSLPAYFGEEPNPKIGNIQVARDRMELPLSLFATRRNMPVLGICRGMQLINIALGGTLYQDLATDFPGKSIAHAPKVDLSVGSHSVRLAGGRNELRDILGLKEGTPLMVNSLHHQAVKKAGKGLRVVATAPDGVIEALSGFPEKNIIAVQWHPEQMAAKGDAVMKRLFRFFVTEAALYKRAKAIHMRSVVLDSHNDTPMTFTATTDLSKRGDSQVDLCRMREGLVSTSIMIAYLPQGALTAEAHNKAYRYALDKLDAIKRQTDAHPDKVCYATSAADIRAAKRNGLLSIVPSIENGYAMGTDLSRLDTFRERGVVYITLCHNGDNALCDAAQRSKRTHKGISALGEKAILRMNELGILVDVSHTSEETTRQALRISRKPIIASHSSAKGIYNHPRNLSDEMLKAIADKGGVVQVCLYHGFIAPNRGEADIRKVADHIDHIVKVAGIHAVGVGSDFDGGGGLIGLRGSNDLIRLTVELLRRGYSDDALEALWGGNFLRVMEANGR